MWQSIETAPKDGTPVLLYKPNEKRMGAYTLAGYWDGQWWGCGGWELVWRSRLDHKEYGRPTHWQPLPEPPED